jgi:hypothetical protein
VKNLVKKEDKHRIQSKHLGGGSVGFEPMQKIWKLISTSSSYNVATYVEFNEKYLSTKDLTVFPF